MKMILNDKQDCIDSIAKVLERIAAWRKAIAVNFPDDNRNIVAAATLEKLAVDVANLTDEQWSRSKALLRLGFWNVAQRIEPGCSLGRIPQQGKGFQFLCQSTCSAVVAVESRVMAVLSMTKVKPTSSIGENAARNILSAWKGKHVADACIAATQIGLIHSGGLLAYNRAKDILMAGFEVRLIDDIHWSTVNEAFQNGRNSGFGTTLSIAGLVSW